MPALQSRFGPVGTVLAPYLQTGGEHYQRDHPLSMAKEVIPVQKKVISQRREA